MKHYWCLTWTNKELVTYKNGLEVFRTRQQALDAQKDWLPEKTRVSKVELIIK